MMNLNAALLSSVASPGAKASNINSIVVSLDQFGAALGLNQPHRFVQYGAQIAHESGGFKYDAELWGKEGGTAAQKRYDQRTDLGNSPELDGDGFKYRGRTGIQITGKDNYRQFRDWCRAKFPDANVPDFVADPDAVNLDPWEGLGPLWYWDTRNLNSYADSGDIEMITKRINGGRNGLADRIERYETLGLAVLGYDAKDMESVKTFQRLAQSEGHIPADKPGEPTQIDGDIGPKTRAAIHIYLVKRGSVPVAETKPAPVTEVVPVAPKGAEKVNMGRVAGGIGVVATGAAPFLPDDDWIKLALVGITIVAVIVLVWKQELVAARVRSAIKLFGIGSDE
jgi:putative chitinase